jgi:hypothetical protein
VSFLKSLSQRAAEPSTHAGLAVLATLFGASPDAASAVADLIGTAAGVANAGPVTAHGVVALSGAAFAAASMFLKEKGKT